MTENLHGLVAAYAAYAVDAVDVEERAAFEAHLPGCEDCTLELAELREVAAQIGAAETGPVPPGLRASVLAEVSRTAQVPPHATTPGPATPTPASVPGPGPDKDGSFMTLMDTPMEDVAAIAVTEEPRGGSEQPTSDAVAAVDL